MRNAIVSFTGFIIVVVFLSLSSVQCSKEVEVKTDTVIVRDTTVVTVDTTINLSKGLLVYYPFNNNAGDSSGNGRNGTVTGSLQYSTDKNNKPNTAAQFDGTSSYVSLADNGSLSPTSITICTEFYVTAAMHQTLFGKIRWSDAASISWGASLFGNAPGYPNSANFGVRGTAVACGTFDPMSYSDLVYTMEDIQINKWYHIACVFDKGIEKIYLNGKLRHAVTRDFQTPKQCTNASIFLGAWYEAAPLYFKGKMDEFRMYNRALNDLEIAQIGKGF